tara:strand:+ start:683 stop:889 length:207 start_codon:yes stop_codon:yes gene_type:complete
LNGLAIGRELSGFNTCNKIVASKVPELHDKLSLIIRVHGDGDKKDTTRKNAVFNKLVMHLKFLILLHE